MAIWAWMQPVDKMWKVVSDSRKGTILVYDEKSDLVLEKKGLSPEAVLLIEKHFLDVVATKMTENKTKAGNLEVATVTKPKFEYNYMYA